jgi:hypothetical protein
MPAISWIVIGIGVLVTVGIFVARARQISSDT